MSGPRTRVIGWSVAALALLLAGTGVAANLKGDLRLIDAVRRQDAAAVRALITQVDVNTPAPDGATALHWAAHLDDLATADLLTRARARVNATNDYGVTPLSLACTNGNTAMIALLLTRGADANLPLPSGETPLMTAARTGNVEAVKTLLAHGADVAAREPTAKQNALMWALSEGHLAVAQTLLEAGADVHARSAGGSTPLLFAVRQGSLDATTALLARGADVNEAADDGVGALLVATLRGHETLAEFLLDQGADADAGAAGYTALHWAVGRWESTITYSYANTRNEEWAALGGVPTRKIELIKKLLAKGADPNARMTKRLPRFGFTLFSKPLIDGATPFLLAALSADVDVMRLLVANGADPMLKTPTGHTAMMFAAGLGRVVGDSLITDGQATAAVRQCLEFGNDITATNIDGDTALHGSAYFGHDGVAQFLIEHGAPLNARNKKGETPLKVAQGYAANMLLVINPSTAAVISKLGGKVD